MSIDNVLARIDQDLEGSLARLFELVRFKSISTDPAYADDCLSAAGWCAATSSRSARSASAA